ncbi:complement factor D [Cynoglossus semilaevis]|nr:complement factor D [Cynoglossus semilaevis]
MASVKDLILAAALLVAALVSLTEGIMGGGEAAPHSRPYMASIQKPEGEKMIHECGGFVVADQWVMSAAHCLSDGINGRKIVLGVHSLSQVEDTKQTFDILEVHNHPSFQSYNFDNDIALIKLDRTYNSTEAVQAVQFLRAGGSNPETDAEVETAGWGSQDNLGTRPDKLQELTIDVFSSRRCKRSDYYGRKFTDNMMCAYRVCQDPCNKPHEKEDSCDGDSGGPLLYQGVVVGVTSNGGKKCGQLKKPGIYTIVSRYTEWIDSIIGSQPTAAPQST